MKDTYSLSKHSRKTENTAERPQTGILKVITWILAYSVWMFIFLIPVIGILIIIVYLLKNRQAAR